MMASLLPTALAYAARGHRVFALSPASKIPPAGSRGASEATTDPEEVRRLFGRVGDGAGIGIVPGPRYWVLDADTEPPRAHLDGWTGLRALEELAREYGPFPVCPTAETPRGGRHLWWIVPESTVIRPCSRGLLVLGTWSGLDVRAGPGSYVVAPPTRVRVEHGSLAGQVRPYRWLVGGTPPLAPGWLLALVAREEPPPEHQRPHELSGTVSGRAERYAFQVLETACAACTSPSPGRHDRWLRQARTVGGYVASGLLGHDLARDRLTAAALLSLTPGERRARDVQRTIRDGLELGERVPCYPPECP